MQSLPLPRIEKFEYILSMNLPDRIVIRFASLKVYLVFLSLFTVLSTGPLSAKIRLEKIFSVSFSEPIDMSVYPEKINGERLFAIAEKKGIIYLTSLPGGKYSRLKILMIDMRKQICSSGYEEGLLGLAFDPNFIKNQRAYIYYSKCNPRTANISRITLAYKLQNEIPEFSYKEEKILTIDEPYSNHNGGCLQFGPDGYLYIGIGDGGSAGDPHNNAQNLDTLLGKILRIDIQPESGYKIPPDNPFINTRRPEIFAYGLRNPWRFTVNKKNGTLVAGDVGQDNYEEIAIVRKGENHGWRIMEGFHCFNPGKNCDTKNLVLPVYEYDHRHGRSIIGGHFYQNERIPILKNKYIFGDYVSGKIWYIDLSEPPTVMAVELLNTGINISSFASDNTGEVYVIGMDTGDIYKFTVQ